MSAALDAARAALRDARAWVVGGAVRDRLLGRPTDDVDIAVDGDVRAAARKLAMEAGGPAFELSDRFGAWRVLAPDRSWHVDLVPLNGATIEEDLSRRDFTINAIAEPLAGGQLVDPHDGAGAVRERRLVMVAERSFDDDPLRVLRLARFSCELGLAVDDRTRAAARSRAPRIAGVAQERVLAELKRLVMAPEPVDGLRLLDDLGLTAHVLPELDALRGVGQGVYHHLDVHGHTIAALQAAVDLERDPGAVLGEELAAGVRAFLAEPLADELPRSGGLRLGALLHDVAKPQTRAELPDGRVGFPGHDRAGEQLVRAALTRLRASDRLASHVAALTRHHLRLGFLVHEAPLDRRAVHRYLVATAPVAADVTLLTVADRLATRGRNADEAIAKHLALAAVVLRAALDRHAAGPPAPLIRGDELARALGITPGPALGRLLAEIEEARYAGEVSTPDEAVALARRVLGEPPAPG